MAEYVIGTYIFESKKAAQERYSKILSSWDLYENIQGDDIHLLFALLDAHPWRQSIVGSSRIVGFQLWPTEYRTRQIVAVRENGEIVKFPIRRAFAKRNKTKLELFRERCRRAIAPQIIGFKRRYWELYGYWECEVTHELLKLEDVHIDHIYSFECMLQDWLKDRPNEYSDASVEGFAEYHSQNAKLRVVSKTYNLGRRDYECY